ncbi:hypothetical protein SBA2_620003 [Acidobacteriia bacterium SbA2]|nr:hypothetical protein SBA2_620003 [Acidobacteriia bacterium SbA2]
MSIPSAPPLGQISKAHEPPHFVNLAPHLFRAPRGGALTNFGSQHGPVGGSSFSARRDH